MIDIRCLGDAVLLLALHTQGVLYQELFPGLAPRRAVAALRATSSPGINFLPDQLGMRCAIPRLFNE